jgi:hypothetical protein
MSNVADGRDRLEAQASSRAHRAHREPSRWPRRVQPSVQLVIGLGARLVCRAERCHRCRRGERAAGASGHVRRGRRGLSAPTTLSPSRWRASQARARNSAWQAGRRKGLINSLSSPGKLTPFASPSRGISYAYCVRRRSGLSCIGRLLPRLPSAPGRAPATPAPVPTPAPAPAPAPAKAAENAERKAQEAAACRAN